MIQIAIVTLIDGLVTTSRIDEGRVVLALDDKLYEGDELDTSFGSLQAELASGTLIDIPQGKTFTVNLDNLNALGDDPGEFSPPPPSDDKPHFTTKQYYGLYALLLLLAGVPAGLFIKDHLSADAGAAGEDEPTEGGTAFSLASLFAFGQIVSGFVTKSVSDIQPDLLEYPSGGGDDAPQSIVHTLALTQPPVDKQPEAGGQTEGESPLPIGEGGIPFIIPIAFPFDPVTAGFLTKGFGVDFGIEFPEGYLFIPDEPDPFTPNDTPEVIVDPERGPSSLLVREQVIGFPDTNNYSNFFLVQPGSDGLASQSFALVAQDGSDSGLLHSITGDRILLFQTAPDTVEGRSELTGDMVIEVKSDDLGNVTLKQEEGILHPESEDILQVLADRIGLMTTVVDGNGDVASEIVDIGPTLNIVDHVPSIDPDTPVDVNLAENSDTQYIRLLNTDEGADVRALLFFSGSIDKTAIKDTDGTPLFNEERPLYYHIDPGDISTVHATYNPTTYVPSEVIFTITLKLVDDDYTLDINYVDSLLWRPQSLALEVGIIDADLDIAKGTIIYNMQQALLAVGTSAEDIVGSTPPYLEGEGSEGSNMGAFIGNKTGDLFIGNGGTLLQIDGSGSYVFIADVSGSMQEEILAGIPGSAATQQRIEALRTAYAATFTQLHNSLGSEPINVILIKFARTAETVGTFDLRTDAGLTAALLAVDSLTIDPLNKLFNFTNYEAAYQEAEAAIAAEASINPGFLTADTKQVIFTTDGEPNRHIRDSDDTVIISGDADVATRQIEGIIGLDLLGDDSDEITNIESAFGPIDAVGIDIDDPGALAILDRTEASDSERPATAGSADNVTSTVEFVDVLLGLALPENFSFDGRDTLLGNQGPDLLLGDAVDTDQLILDKALPLPTGSNFETFLYLEADDDNNWDRQTTVEYIKANIETVTNEITALARLVAGDDFIDGGPGNDDLYGQGGNDTIIGGTGEDLIVGGAGTAAVDGGGLVTKDNSLTGGVAGSTPTTSDNEADTFLFNFGELKLDGVQWTITDFEKDHDILYFNNIVDDGADPDPDGSFLDLLAGFNNGINFNDDGTDVTVEFSNATFPSGFTNSTLVFLGVGTGAITGFGDLVSDPTTQVVFDLV